MSQTSYPLSRIAKNIILSATIPGATVAFAMSVFGSWQSLDTAAPAAGDDPFNNRQVIGAVPLLQAQRTVNQTDTNSQETLNNWIYTSPPPPPPSPPSSTGFP